MPRPLFVCAVIASLAAAGPWVAAQSRDPSPSPPPTPAPAAPARLRLDIERHVDSMMRDHGGRPNFETSVDVLGRAPDVALEEQLAGFDLECGPTLGPPTAVESREFRPHPAPYLDLSVVAQMLSGALSQPRPPRYFLYRVRGPDGAPDYVLREEPFTTPPGQQPVAAFELIGSFPDLDSAVRGWRRIDRGFPGVQRADAADPPPPWATTNCRLRPRK